jgi:hypothetical protein
MSNENNDDTNTNQNEGDEGKPLVPNVDEIVKKKVEEEIKDIKSKLDSAYNARDEALKKAQALEEKSRAEEIARLKEEGKHREAYEKEIAEERAKREKVEQANVELTRNITVKTVLQGLPFKNQRSLEMAYKEIVNELVRNENGEWVHKTGISIQDFVKSFSEHDDNAFLFRQKASSGAGGNSGNLPGNSDTKPKSLFEMPQEEVLALAAEGKLPRK